MAASDPSLPDPPPRYAGWRLTACILASLTLGALFMTKTWPSAAVDLDPSWKATLGHDLLEERQFGRDDVFTYGLFGYFVADQAPYVPGLYYLSLVVRALLGLGAAAIFVAAGRAIRPWPLQVLGIAAVLLVVPHQRELVHLVAIAALPAAIAASRKPTLPWLAAAGLYVVAVALAKHTLAFVAFVSLACAVAIVARRRGPRIALQAAIVFVAELVVIWIAARQDLRNLPEYFRGAVESVVAYADSMLHSEPFERQILTLGTGAALALACCADFVSRIRSRRDLAGALAVIPILAAGAVATKLGVTRSDDGHRVVANGALLLLGFVSASGGSRAGDVFRGITVASATIGFFVASSTLGATLERAPAMVRWHVSDLDEILHPVEARARHEALRSEIAARHALPETARRIGAEPVDLVGSSQGVLYLAGMNVRHRPVFQDYAVFSPALNARNAAFFESPEAPRFVIARPSSIDDRLFTVADSATLRALLVHYRPIGAERGYVLLERIPGASVPGPTQVRHVAVPFGKRVDLSDLSDRLVEISADIELTAGGRLASLAVRSPLFWIHVTFHSGAERRWRISPSLVKAPFIVNPFIDSIGSLLDLHGHRVGERVRSIRFEVEPGRESWVRRSVGVTVWCDDALWSKLAPQSGIDVRKLLSFPTFFRPPDQVEPAASVWALGDDPEGVIAHPVSRMSWDVGPGSWRVRGAYGIVSKAWEIGSTDGVTFVVELEDADGAPPREIFRRYLAPRDRLMERGELTFDLPFDLAAPGRLVLRTDPGPAQNAEWDWSYWAGIKIERAP